MTTTNVPSACPACGSTLWIRVFDAPDPMYDLRRRYPVLRCTSCRSYAIAFGANIDRLAAHPLGDYYSYRSSDGDVRLLRAKATLYRLLFANTTISHLGRAIGGVGTQLMRTLPADRHETLLDIGCGAGNFLAIAQRLGYACYGVEPNPRACEMARTVATAVFCGRVEDFDRPAGRAWPGSFDVITANHVFEHLENPEMLLKLIRRLLSPDGRAFLAVPNPSSIIARLFGSYWSQLDAPRHVFLFTDAAITEMLSRHGLEVRRRRYIGNEYGIAQSIVVRIGILFGLTRARVSPLAYVLFRIAFFPLFSAFNLFRSGDTVEYEISRQ